MAEISPAEVLARISRLESIVGNDLPRDTRNNGSKKPPVFSGQGRDAATKARDFSVKYQLYGKLSHHPIEHQIIEMRMYLEDDAARWYDLRMLRPDAGTLTLEALCEEMVQAFSPVNQVEQARDRLASLRQTTSVSAYNAMFRAYLLRAGGAVSPSEALSYYLRGLKSEIGTLLDITAPADVLTAMNTAERLDARMWRRHQGRGMQQQRFGYPPAAAQQPAAMPAPMELGAKRQPPFRGYCRACGAWGHIAAACRHPGAGRVLPVSRQQQRRENA
jgi:hypothetical protein